MQDLLLDMTGRVVDIPGRRDHTLHDMRSMGPANPD